MEPPLELEVQVQVQVQVQAQAQVQRRATTKKKVAPRAVYKTSLVAREVDPPSEDETVIMRLNISAGQREDVPVPDAYNASAVSLVGAATLEEECVEGAGAGSGSCTPTFEVTESLFRPVAPAVTSVNGMRVMPLLAEFNQKSRNSEWPSMTSICCYWCCHGFENTPVGLPVRRSGDIFHVTGCFCSLACAAAYNFGMPRVSVDRALERFMLINSLATKIGCVGEGAIKPAPDRLALAMFGGPMGIDEFRAYGNSHRHVIINQPPMLTLMQQVEEVDELDMKSAYSYIPLDIARVEKFQEKVRLRRTRPLVDPRNTLDHCMKLRYGPDQP